MIGNLENSFCSFHPLFVSLMIRFQLLSSCVVEFKLLSYEGFLEYKIEGYFKIEGFELLAWRGKSTDRWTEFVFMFGLSRKKRGGWTFDKLWPSCVWNHKKESLKAVKMVKTFECGSL